MSILIHNCTAVLMDEAGTVLPNAYVVVEGTKIRSVSTQRPWLKRKSNKCGRKLPRMDAKFVSVFVCM